MIYRFLSPMSKTTKELEQILARRRQKNDEDELQASNVDAQNGDAECAETLPGALDRRSPLLGPSCPSAQQPEGQNDVESIPMLQSERRSPEPEQVPVSIPCFKTSDAGGYPEEDKPLPRIEGVVSAPCVFDFVEQGGDFDSDDSSDKEANNGLELEYDDAFDLLNHMPREKALKVAGLVVESDRRSQSLNDENYKLRGAIRRVSSAVEEYGERSPEDAKSGKLPKPLLDRVAAELGVTDVDVPASPSDYSPSGRQPRMKSSKSEPAIFENAQLAELSELLSKHHNLLEHKSKEGSPNHASADPEVLAKVQEVLQQVEELKRSPVIKAVSPKSEPDDLQLEPAPEEQKDGWDMFFKPFAGQESEKKQNEAEKAEENAKVEKNVDNLLWCDADAGLHGESIEDETLQRFEEKVRELGASTGLDTAAEVIAERFNNLSTSAVDSAAAISTSVKSSSAALSTSVVDSAAALSSSAAALSSSVTSSVADTWTATAQTSSDKIAETTETINTSIETAQQVALDAAAKARASIFSTLGWSSSTDEKEPKDTLPPNANFAPVRPL